MKKATFRIDYGDRRTPALLHDIHTWLHVNTRDGWRIREEDMVDEEEQEGRRWSCSIIHRTRRNSPAGATSTARR